MFIVFSSIKAAKCNLTFIGNTASVAGGGASIGFDTSDFLVNTKDVELSGHFTNNRARCGGAVFIKNEKHVILNSVSVGDNSASAVCVYDSTVTFSQTTTIFNNTGGFGGGIYSSNSALSLDGDSLLDSNTARSGGAMYLLHGTVSLAGTVTFTHNSAERDGGALYAVSTVMDFLSEINFTFNSARNGGAVYLNGEVVITLELPTQINFSFNEALDYGGGIYCVDNTDPIQCSYTHSIYKFHRPSSYHMY